MNQDIKTITDLELAKIQGQIYGQLMQAQSNLLIINQELERREKLANEKDKKEIEAKK